jgi:carboxymethylenebutenolidase
MRSITRRDFMTTATLAAGFALAVQPVSRKTIATDATGLVAGAVQIIVLVIQEIFGVHEHIQDVARRFAKLGYLAIAPELFVRQGDVSQLSDIDQIRAIVTRVPDAQVLSDLDATINWVAKSAPGNLEQVGITGFCWGGRITWLYADHNPTVKAGVAWYGRLVGDITPLTPQQPVDVASTLTVPVLGLYGGKDTGIPLESVEKMRTQLELGSSQSEIVVYPDAPHAFFADYRPSYREADAIDGWNRLQAWFKQYGVG